MNVVCCSRDGSLRVKSSLHQTFFILNNAWPEKATKTNRNKEHQSVDNQRYQYKIRYFCKSFVPPSNQTLVTIVTTVHRQVQQLIVLPEAGRWYIINEAGSCTKYLYVSEKNEDCLFNHFIKLDQRCYSLIVSYFIRL